MRARTAISTRARGSQELYPVNMDVNSEARKGAKTNPGVMQLFRSTLAADRYLSVQTVGEIRRGVENIRRRGDQEQAARLEAWLGAVIGEYANRILSVDSDCAQVWGRLISPQASNPIDNQIAAISLILGLVVVLGTSTIFLQRATGAVPALIQCLGAARQIGDDEARIGAARIVFAARDDAPLSIPRSCRLHEFPDHALLAAGL